MQIKPKSPALLLLLTALAAPLHAAAGACDQLSALPANPDAEAVRYLSGACALERREYREAIRQLEPLVAQEDYPVYRADLGRAYLGAQEFERARAEFLKALASNPPEEARALLQVFLQMADQQQTQAKDWIATLSLGWRHDSNVNGGPGNREVTLYGLPFTWSDDTLPKSDQAWRIAGALTHAKTLGGSLSWQTNAQLEWLRHQTHDAYDTSWLALDSGPHFSLAGGSADLYLPLGLSRTWLADADYVRMAWFAPQLSLTLNPRNQLLLAVSAQKKDYLDSPALGSVTRGASLAWRHELASRWVLEPSVKCAEEAAEDPAYSNRTRSLGLALRGNLPAGLRLNAEANYTRAEYAAAESWAAAPRADHRMNYALGFSRDLGGGYYGALSWSRARVVSNLGLYDTTRDVFQVQISKAF